MVELTFFTFRIEKFKIQNLNSIFYLNVYIKRNITEIEKEKGAVGVGGSSKSERATKIPKM